MCTGSLRRGTLLGSSLMIPWPRSNLSIFPPVGTPPKTSSIPSHACEPETVGRGSGHETPECGNVAE
eukprot:scaffold265074_cov28-Tisochrysis_lutea.AAC.5